MSRSSDRSALLPWCMCVVAGAMVATGCSPSFPIGFDTDAGTPATVDGSQPEFGPTIEAQTPPPAISGGTLIIDPQSRVLYASDPDRDRVWIVDRRNDGPPSEIVLHDHDEPGRLVLDAAHHLHVALRRGGAVVTIDTTTHEIIERRTVCGAPRGIVFDATTDSIHVACAGGELVTLPAAGGAETRRLTLEPDLRDVAMSDNKLWVSTFRTPTLRSIGPDGVVSSHVVGPAQFTSNGPLRVGLFQPAVAYRMIAIPGNGFAMVHQRGFNSSVLVGSGRSASGTGVREYYGSPPVPINECDSSIVHSTVSILRPENPFGTTNPGPPIPDAVLPVDIAMTTVGAPSRYSLEPAIAIVAAGNSKLRGHRQLFVYPLSTFESTSPCANIPLATRQPTGQAVAVVFDTDGNAIVQTREPASIQLMSTGETILLGTRTREDTGHSIFHSNAGSSIACASCHPEGSDDGRVWILEAGPRRTQNLRGGILSTAPFHWEGDLPDVGHLMNQVFVGRMNGPEMRDDQVAAVARWIDSSPALVATSLPEATTISDGRVERGRALFNDSTVGCAGCHGGERMTNNQTVDVGTGGFFQVPSLVGLRDRAPYMHNGCAATLRDRFGTPPNGMVPQRTHRCGGDERHGHTANLTSPQIDDLVSYLSTL